jgi:NADP-dependent 3-hydroxy acid dehydrogenase YdfG
MDKQIIVITGASSGFGALTECGVGQIAAGGYQGRARLSRRITR